MDSTATTLLRSRTPDIRAYNEGYLAFPTYKPRSPYPEDSEEDKAWWLGYVQAELVSAYYNDGDDE
jgi:hypothetical protein